MSGTTTPPLYVIQSKVGGSDWVLTVKGESTGYYLRLNHNAADEKQLWLREEDPSRGGFFLRNPFLDRCLRAGSSQGGEVSMAAKSIGDPELIWRKEQDANWGCLNKLQDWEQKLNCAGNGPYDDNTRIVQYEYDRGSDHELWKLVQYEPFFGPTNVVYDEGAKQLILGDPITADVTTVDNRSSSASLNTTVTLRTSVQKTMTHSVSDATQKTLTVAQTFGAKFGIDKMFEVSEQGSVTAARSTTHTVGDTTGTTDTVEVTATASILVPAGKSYDLALMLRKCTLTIPYTATISRRTVVGQADKSFSISGTYRYENSYHHDIVVTDPDTHAVVAHAVSQLAINRKGLSG